MYSHRSLCVHPRTNNRSEIPAASRARFTDTAHTGDKGELPDPRCTPGFIDPIVTQSNIRSTICKGGWTDPHLRPPESQTEAFKYDVAYPAYGTPRSDQSELDHLVPLELGGSNDATNLWPEVGKPSGNPKDKVENALNAAVCDGRVSLAAAQQAIASDWLTAEKRLGSAEPSAGHRHPPAGRGARPALRPQTTAGPVIDVYVKSNQPDRDATASDANDTWSYDTNGSGAATIYLRGTRRRVRPSGSRSAGRHARRRRNVPVR